MSEVMVVGLLSLAGTLVGSIGGIMTANRMAMYRIEQLEKRVGEHNRLADRTIILERDLKSAFRLIDENKSGINEVAKELKEVMRA